MYFTCQKMVSIVLPRKPSLVSDDSSLGPRIVMNSSKSTCPSPEKKENNCMVCQIATDFNCPERTIVVIINDDVTLNKSQHTNISAGTPSLVSSEIQSRVTDKCCSCPDQLRLMCPWAEHPGAHSLQLKVCKCMKVKSSVKRKKTTQKWTLIKKCKVT